MNRHHASSVITKLSRHSNGGGMGLEMDKVGHIFPADANDAITQAIATYRCKRYVGVKKRKGIMSEEVRILKQIEYQSFNKEEYLSFKKRIF